jgi:NAD(P)H-hydrate epimerase
MIELKDISNTPLPRLAPRKPESHKGDYGRALLIGGSRGMSGAIALAGLAALRSGAGLVTLAVPCTIQDVVAGYNPSYMTVGLADDGQRLSPSEVDEALVLAQSMTALALGPGLGRAEGVTQFVARLYRQVCQPMVVDADALFALAERRELLAQAAGPRILTPHAGEFARLTGTQLASDDSARIRAAGAAAAAAGRNTVVVLKGHNTIVTNGAEFSMNDTGNPGMATGGTGDVLTGVIVARLCLGFAPFDAARLGVHLHGSAGDLAAAQLGQVSLIASDLVGALPAAFQSLSLGAGDE